MSSDIDEIFEFSSAGSSDSECFLVKDRKNSENHTNKQWEAIERTLYQEAGQQVTNPELIKECKLWRETFPHFRIRGTKIEVKKPNVLENVVETQKNIPTLDAGINLTKLNEKRKNIKDKVVEELVERIIAKFSLNKEDNAELSKTCENGLKISKIHESPAKSLNSSLKEKTNKNKQLKSVIFNTQKESYFERGKFDDNENLTQEKDGNLFQITNNQEKHDIIVSPQPFIKSDISETTKSFKNHNISRKHSKELNRPIKPNRFSTSSDSALVLSKPFEMTKKIDKKYQGLLEKIMERKYNELGTTRICETSSYVETKKYQESLEKLQTSSRFNDSLRNNKNLPKINKFKNNWIERGEINSYNFTENNLLLTGFENSKTKSGFSKNVNMYKMNTKDKKVIEKLEKEINLNYKRPSKNIEIIEETYLKRPNSLKLKKMTEKTQKSASCGDLPQKNKNIRSRQFKSCLDNKIHLQSRAKFTNSNSTKISKSSVSKNCLFPVIESGIICTELKGHPKIEPRNPRKRF